MDSPREYTELIENLRSDSGKDFLSSLPLVSSQIQSTTIMEIIRVWCQKSLPKVEEQFECEICLLAFGSLGRLEFVRSLSDLDPLILIAGSKRALPMEDEFRKIILGPLARDNPWLQMDDRAQIVNDDWIHVSGSQLKYPVYKVDDINKGHDERTKQRQWQILLEARSLYNEKLFVDVYSRFLPTYKRSASLIDGTGSETIIDFRRLTETIPEFYTSFENPAFLYKSAFKYWKSRFLREFYTFATSLSFVLGWYLQSEHQTLEPGYLRASTAIKIMRSIQFAEELERELKNNHELANYYEEEIKSILIQRKIDINTLLLFGNHYSTMAARLLYGMLVCVLSRFAACWERIYDIHVRETLELIPKEKVNFDATFKAKIQNPEAADVIEELTQLRNSYKKYMAAAAQVINTTFPKGRVWLHQSVPQWVHEVLKPFYPE